MPLSLVRSDSNAALWSACCTDFLAEVGGHAGPEGFGAFLLLTHRVQRDALLRQAAARGLAGWLDPPFAFFSDLRRLFGIEARPVGILTGRMLVARLAARRGTALGLAEVGEGMGPAGTHMLDRVFSELLPEGVSPDRLRAVLTELDGDPFARRRNAWVADTYEAFLGELAQRSLYDPRSIHAMVAERIESGDLGTAVGGASRLLVYGLTSLRGRARLVQALAAQQAIDVRVYLPLEGEPSEWEELATGNVVSLTDAGTVMSERTRTEVAVQPTPDAVREAAWIARRIKRLLVDGTVEPHDVAVVARSGHRDTRILHRALESAGVPATARLRTVLAEVPAIKALLGLLRAEAEGWRYEDLRQALESPYYGVGMDLRAMDFLASQRRFVGLDAWEEALAGLRQKLDDEPGRLLARRGFEPGQLDEDLTRLRTFRTAVAALQGDRPETAWIEATLALLGGEYFDLRRRLCRPVGDRYDLVRLDQRGVLQVQALLREWRELIDRDEVLSAGDWHGRLARLLAANDLALSTPLREGVQVLEAHEAALTPFSKVFLVHANDGEFPRAHVAAGVFSDEERERLREIGLPLTHRRQALRRERALWRSVVQNDSVVVTYRTTDASGNPRLPSLMVPEHETSREIPRTLDLATLEDRRTTTLEAVSPPQHRRQEVLRLARTRRSGDRSTFRTPEPHALRHAILTAFADSLRQGELDGLIHSEAELSALGGTPLGAVEPPDVSAVLRRDVPLSHRPTAWNGKLRDPLVLAALGQKFDDTYIWSASQLETYGKRPFDFLLERVLRLEEISEAEEETSPLAFGSIAHAILEEFYRELLEDPPATFDEYTAAAYESAAARVIGRAESDREQWLGLPPLWAVTRDRVREQVRDYVAAELEYLARVGEKPFRVELQFGGEAQPEVMVRGRDTRGVAAALRLRGRIDRIDLFGSGAGATLRVLDYKSGVASMPKRSGYLDGALLQMALYMKAAELLGLGSVDQGRYRSIRDFPKKKNVYPLRWSEIEPTLRLALSIPGRVRSGLFEAVQAASTEIRDWQPQPEVTRTDARLSGGSRFDTVAE